MIPAPGPKRSTFGTRPLYNARNLQLRETQLQYLCGEDLISAYFHQLITVL